MQRSGSASACWTSTRPCAPAGPAAAQVVPADWWSAPRWRPVRREAGDGERSSARRAGPATPPLCTLVPRSPRACCRGPGDQEVFLFSGGRLTRPWSRLGPRSRRVRRSPVRDRQKREPAGDPGGEGRRGARVLTWNRQTESPERCLGLVVNGHGVVVDLYPAHAHRGPAGSQRPMRTPVVLRTLALVGCRLPLHRLAEPGHWPGGGLARSRVARKSVIRTRTTGVGGGDLKVGGGEEIRTPGPLRDGGFQDRCLKPLGHPSAVRSG